MRKSIILLASVIIVLMFALNAQAFEVAQRSGNNSGNFTVPPSINSRPAVSGPISSSASDSWLTEEVARISSNLKKTEGQRDQAISQRNKAKRQVTNLQKWFSSEVESHKADRNKLGKVTDELDIANKTITSINKEKNEAQKEAGIAWDWSNGFQHVLHDEAEPSIRYLQKSSDQLWFHIYIVGFIVIMVVLAGLIVAIHYHRRDQETIRDQSRVIKDKAWSGRKQSAEKSDNQSTAGAEAANF